jgi:outer membrane biosynthesis protein TonB
MDFDDEPEQPPQSFLKRFRIAIVVTAVVLVGIIAIAKLASSGGGSSRRESITMVSLPPPPPPPPPPVMTPPPPPPQQEEQKMEQPMIKEEQPKEAPPKDEPPLGTGIKGDGPDSFGLSDKAGNGRIGGNDANGSKWGWYANQVQSRIQQALQQNRKTHSASLSVNVRVWPDATGRINRAQITGSTGDPALDSALRDEVLTGLQLQEPPPAGMPAPITLRLTARRPR